MLAGWESDHTRKLSGDGGRSMKRWLRRLVYGLLLILWLVVMTLPALAFLLAVKGELQIGEQPQSHLRLFLLQDEQAQGVAVEWVRPSRQDSDCHQGNVTYVLWKGEAENAVYCQCADPSSGELKSVTNQGCPAP